MKNITKYALALLIAFCSLLIEVNAQVAINDDNANPNASAMLDVSSTDKGLLIPRMTSDQRTMIANPETGLLVFDTDSTNFQFYNGTEWMALLADTLSVIADGDNDTKIQVEKNEDEDMIRIDLGGTEYFRLDSGRVEILNTGRSIYIGESAGAANDLSQQKNNVGIGYEALQNDVGLGSNVAVGYRSLQQNTDGSSNVGVGYQALRQNTTGQSNIAMGYFALQDNTIGEFNTGLGYFSLAANTIGERNTAVGYFSLAEDTTGFGNTALGYSALSEIKNGHYNTALGYRAGGEASGSYSIYIGNEAGGEDTSSYKLYIEPSDADSTEALIFGEFDTNRLRVNGKLNVTEHLSVKAGGNGIETLDANNTTAQNLYDDPGATWQSYTALNDGILSRVELEFRDGSGTRTVSIYEGEGTAGNLRGTVTTDVTASGIYFANFDLSTNQIEQLAGEVYTIAIDSKDRLFVEGSNPYDGGREKGGADRDLSFKVYSEGIGSFNVGIEGVNINNYTFPSTDGAANQLLATDGNGNLDWVDEPTFTDTDTDDQTLSFNGTSLSIADGNTVDLSALEVPIGTIQMWATSTAPDGWLICNGSSFSASTYPELNNILGGNTLPNFSGRFPLGVGNSGTSGSTNHNISSNGGEEKHTLTINEMPSHSHGAGSLKTSQAYLSEAGSGDQDKRDGGGTKLYAYDDITGSTASVGGNQSHNNMPPFYTINFIIKAE